MKIVSVNVGLPREVVWKGTTVQTAETHVSRGMKTTECGPATARLSPTATVAPPSSMMTTSSALWCLWKGMIAPGPKASVITKKSSAFPSCLSILRINSGIEPVCAFTRPRPAVPIPESTANAARSESSQSRASYLV